MKTIKTLKAALLILVIAIVSTPSLLAMDPAGGYLTFVSSNEEKIKVSRTHPILTQSETLKIMIDDLGGIDSIDEKTLIPLNVDAETMQQVLGLIDGTIFKFEQAKLISYSKQ